MIKNQIQSLNLLFMRNTCFLNKNNQRTKKTSCFNNDKAVRNKNEIKQIPSFFFCGVNPEKCLISSHRTQESTYFDEDSHEFSYGVEKNKCANVRMRTKRRKEQEQEIQFFTNLEGGCQNKTKRQCQKIKISKKLVEEQRFRSYDNLKKQNEELKKIIVPMKSLIQKFEEENEERDFLISKLEWKLKQLRKELHMNNQSPFTTFTTQF